MRSLLFIFLFFCSFVMQAQTVVYKKIAQRHDVYTASVWKGVDSFRWDYNTNAFLTQQTALKENTGGSWDNYYRYTYTLDANDRVSVQIRENWSGGTWVNNTKYSYDYDANGNVLIIHYDVWNGSVWNVTGKIEYAGYNAQHKYTSEIAFIMSGGNWVYLSKNVFQYYAPGNYLPQFTESYTWNTSLAIWDSLERFYYTYNQDSLGTRTRLIPHLGVWEQESKEVYTFSTTPFLRTEYLTQIWDTIPPTTNVWANDKRINYTYTATDKIEKTNTDKYTAGSWNNESRSQYVYNGNDQISEYYDESFSGSWNNNTRKTFLYTGTNLTEENQFVGLGTAWLQTKKLSYLFDINNLNTFRQIDTFNGAAFYPNNRDFYYYNSFTVNTNDVLNDIHDCDLYPNPARETITLRLNSGKLLQASIRIVDILGKCRVVITQPFFSGSNTIQIPFSSLPVGNYFLQITDAEKGAQLVKKFQVIN